MSGFKDTTDKKGKETMKSNIVTMTDSYKMTHFAQYPENTQKVYSYFEARKGAKFDKTVFFGLQYLLKEYLEGTVVTKEDVDAAEKIAAVHFGNPDIFQRKRWDYIIEKYDGRLPVEIKAVPEGTPVPVDNVLMTVENTDPNCFWLTNHLETMLTWVWHPSTVATLSRETKGIIKAYLEKSADNLNLLPFKLHDFGFRGVSGREAAGLGGAGHLVNFMGTDTIHAMEVAMKYYYANLNTLAFASDSYDIFNAAENILGEELKEQVLTRDGVTVVRPDSGDPVSTVMKLLEILGKKFGTDINEKGYLELNPKVRLIWGDGIDIEGITSILEAMVSNTWSADNITFGMGGGLLQKVNRDTQRFAFKCSAQKRDGVWYDIQKTPIDMSKASKKGKLALIKLEGAHGSAYKTLQECDGPVKGDLLETVFKNGEIVKEWTFDEIRDNAKL